MTNATGGLQRPEWPRPAASAAIFRGGQVLLVVRGKGALTGLWSLPGGHIEPGETAIAAAHREVLEETGIAADVVGLVGIHDALIRNPAGVLTAHYVIAVHYGRWQTGEPHAASDAADSRFVAMADLDQLQLTDGAQRLILRAHHLLTAP
jgi:8-oxo-dGTP diphosphatase